MLILSEVWVVDVWPEHISKIRDEVGPTGHVQRRSFSSQSAERIRAALPLRAFVSKGPRGTLQCE